MSKIIYNLGYVFTESLNKVYLLDIDKPGKLGHGLVNGIGGKVDIMSNETPVHSMIREFREEAGQTINHWEQVGIYTGDDYIIHVFYATVKEAYLPEYKGPEGICKWYDANALPKMLSSNVNISIGMIIRRLTYKNKLFFNLENTL